MRRIKSNTNRVIREIAIATVLEVCYYLAELIFENGMIFGFGAKEPGAEFVVIIWIDIGWSRHCESLVLGVASP